MKHLYVSKDCKVTSESLPIINPYHVFLTNSNSLVKSLKAIIETSIRTPIEYNQASSFSQYQLPITLQVQLVTLQIPPEFPSHWIAQGYTHIHFGAIRLTLAYHARKGLPINALIGLLDTRMKKTLTC